MRKLKSLSLQFDGEKIQILDQTLLPQKQIWLDATDPENMISYIKDLKVRGAPLIGIAATLCLARQAELGRTAENLKIISHDLRASRPTAVNLMNNLNSMDKILLRKHQVKDLVEEAERLFAEDIDLCNKIAQHGQKLITPGMRILTHCNTGGIATAGIGTAMGIIRRAHEDRKNIHVYVDETRPLLQGGRLTTWELDQLHIPNTLICDNAAGFLMAQKKIDAVIVGCDRIARNGDFANKIGTYSLAVLAKAHQIPFYVAGPQTTVDLKCASGAEIPIEERDAKEVLGAKGAFGQVQWAPETTKVYNPAFDVTPAEYVSAWILDTGFWPKPNFL